MFPYTLKSLNWSYGVRDQQLVIHLPMPNSFGNGLHQSDSTRQWARFVRHLHVAPSLSIIGPCSTATWHPALWWRSYAARTRERGTIVRGPTPPTRVGKWIVRTPPPPGGRVDNYEPNEMTWQCWSIFPLSLLHRRLPTIHCCGRRRKFGPFHLPYRW